MICEQSLNFISATGPSVLLFHTCMTFMEAAPARPTFIVTGFTSADLAKFWIFLGIVAEKRSVWRWPYTPLSKNITAFNTHTYF